MKNFGATNKEYYCIFERGLYVTTLKGAFPLKSSARVYVSIMYEMTKGEFAGEHW